MVFFWPRLDRQVRIEGVVSKVSMAQSETYFHSRPRESQIGAWASDQSSVLSNRASLEEKVEAIRREYEGKEIPLPPHWGGFCLKPEQFEFWHQGHEGRLHDRLCYRKDDAGAWSIVRLSP
jgi:pyridoxamine 5'-phosphate oxidase